MIAGHGRVLAAKLLNIPDVPAMVATGWTEAQKAAYRIADNKLTLNGAWDDEMLKAEFAELEKIGFNVELTGFNDLELATFRASVDDVVDDPSGEWQGMPECEAEAVSFRSLVLHFRNQDDVNEFSKLLEQTITDKTKFLWFPIAEHETFIDKKYVA